MKKSKWFYAAIILTAVSVVLTACRGPQTTASSGSGSKTLTTLRVGVDSGTFSTGYRVADLKGYFKQNGIDAQITTFSFGVDTVNAILTGQVDVGVANDFALLSRLSTGKLKILSYVQSADPEASKIVARDGITSPEQLDGKSFGVARATVGEYQTTVLLNHYHIKNAKKVELSSNAEIVAAFQRGDVQAGIFSGNALNQALAVNGAKVIGTLKDADLSARAFLVSSSDYAKKNPKVLGNLLKSVSQALTWTNKNKEQAASILATSLTAPKDATLTELKGYSFELRLSTADVQDLKDINDYAAKNNLYTTSFKLADQIDTSPLKSVLPGKLTYKASELK